jgi:sulfatase modifying factor 1
MTSGRARLTMRWARLVPPAVAFGAYALACGTSTDHPADAGGDGTTSEAEAGPIDGGVDARRDATGLADAARTDGGSEAGVDADVDAGVDAAMDSGVVAFQSCGPGGPGLTNCGAANESCCTSLPVMGGTFYRTYSIADGGSATGLADLATVSSLRMDKYMVTVGRFRQFIAAARGGGWTPPAGSGRHTYLNGGQGLTTGPGQYELGWQGGSVAPTDDLACGANATWTSSPGSNESMPINCVRWYEAYAFCIWDGGFLPSEAEWEYTAAGGSQQRAYPWGAVDPGTSNQYAIYGCYYPSGTGACTAASIAPVGTANLGAGLWGQLDLAGEVAQSTLDYFGGVYPDPCVDCVAGLASGGKQETRGGSYEDLAGRLAPYSRYVWQYSTSHAPWYGVGRCARAP